jgi:hypothetical protein
VRLTSDLERSRVKRPLGLARDKNRHLEERADLRLLGALGYNVSATSINGRPVRRCDSFTGRRRARHLVCSASMYAIRAAIIGGLN